MFCWCLDPCKAKSSCSFELLILQGESFFTTNISSESVEVDVGEAIYKVQPEHESNILSIWGWKGKSFSLLERAVWLLEFLWLDRFHSIKMRAGRKLIRSTLNSLNWNVFVLSNMLDFLGGCAESMISSSIWLFKVPVLVMSFSSFPSDWVPLSSYN